MEYLVKQQINFSFTLFVMGLRSCFFCTSFSTSVKFVTEKSTEFVKFESVMNDLVLPKFWMKILVGSCTSFQNDLSKFS